MEENSWQRNDKHKKNWMIKCWFAVKDGKLREEGIDPFGKRFERTHNLPSYMSYLIKEPKKN